MDYSEELKMLEAEITKLKVVHIKVDEWAKTHPPEYYDRLYQMALNTCKLKSN